MKLIVRFLFIVMAFGGTELISSNVFQTDREVSKRQYILRTLQDYKNFQKIKSIYAVLEKARERQDHLKCEASDILVCLDVDLFSVRTNGGSDPLEDCTAEVYQTLLQEGFKVLRLTARGHGLYVANESKEAGVLRRVNNELIKALGDTSVGFECDDFRMNLDFPSDELREGFTHYGYYLQGTLFAGPYKAYMLGGFLQAIQYLPKVIIMGDDDPGYLFGFLEHKTLRERLGDEIHLLHMPVETHINMNFGLFLEPLVPSDHEESSSESELDEFDNSDFLSPPEFFLEEEEEVKPIFPCLELLSKIRDCFVGLLSVCLGGSG